ncbi:hypothetical protein TNCV_2254301 [Trichonephila clavipes]|nr:hypothetical protein TNCV_2254301 [Trichonephila clavipes]
MPDKVLIECKHAHDAFPRLRESKRFREKLLDRRSSFTSCRKSFNSLRSFDSLLSSELALEYFDTALTCTGVTSKIRSATSEAF